MSSNKQNYNQPNNHSQSPSNQSSQSNNGNNTCQASDYSITKQYGEMKGFMDSYGLKYSDDNDIQEAKQIINEMKKYP